MLTTTPVNADERYEDVSGMSYLAFDQYQREVAWIELLSDEEQDMLLRRVARAQQFPENAHYALLARDARARLVEQYQPLVLKMARGWVRFFEGMEVLDLVNEGSLGVHGSIIHWLL
jgi:DNA-directed RNA polymerase sigma subunit (sigma70/sigma32)